MPLLKNKENKEWLNTIDELKLLSITKNNKDNGEELTPKFLFEKLNDMDKGRFYYSNRSWTTSNVDSSIF